MFKSGPSPRRRPSPAMLVAILALFVAMSGGAYAATLVPRNSVGTAQVRNNAITYRKIAPGQIGHARVAQNQIQWRVTGTCPGRNQAIRYVLPTGGVVCINTLPTLLSTPGLSEPLTSNSSATLLASETLPANYAHELTSNPQLVVSGTGGNQTVTVACQVIGATANQTRSVSVNLDPAHETAAVTLPLQLAVPRSTSSTRAAVGCVRSYTGTVAPKVQAAAGLDAIQTDVDAISATPGTSTAPFTLTTPAPAA